MPPKEVSIKNVARPSNVKAIGIMTIVSGAVNIVASLSLSFTVVLTLVGVVCLPVTLLPAVLGIFEILYGIKLLANPPRPVQPSKTIAILEVVTFLFLNVISGVVGILALVFYSDPETKAYFEAINS